MFLSSAARSAAEKAYDEFNFQPLLRISSTGNNQLIHLYYRTTTRPSIMQPPSDLTEQSDRGSSSRHSDAEQSEAANAGDLPFLEDMYEIHNELKVLRSAFQSDSRGSNLICRT